VDFSSIVLALVVEAVAICLLITLYGSSIPSAGFVITWAFIGVLYFVITIYLYAIFASIIMSLVMLFSGSMNPHPILRLVWQLTEPLMAPVRRVIPPVGGLDFSPMVIIIVIYLIQGVLDQTFGISGSIRAVVIGI
jgi:YggT family protein